MVLQPGQPADVNDILKAHKSDGMLEFKEPTTLTIASGAITPTQNYHVVDTEGAAATDDLDTINGGSDGFVLVLRAANDARTVVVKHNIGNVKINGDADITLDDAHDAVMLVYDATLAKWIVSSKNYDAHSHTLSTSTAALSADVQMLTPGAWYDGPSLSLGAGTWLIVGGLLLQPGNGGGTVAVKLWNGTAVKDSAEYTGIGNGASFAPRSLQGVATIPSGTETWKISAVCSSGGASTVIKAANVTYGAGNNASTIVAVKIG